MNFEDLAEKYINYAIEHLEEKFDNYEGMTVVLEISEDMTKKDLNELSEEIRKDSRVKYAETSDILKGAITITFCR